MYEQLCLLSWFSSWEDPSVQEQTQQTIKSYETQPMLSEVLSKSLLLLPYSKTVHISLYYIYCYENNTLRYFGDMNNTGDIDDISEYKCCGKYK